MVDIATNVTTNVCRRPLVKDCNPSEERETICRTEYQSECWSKQIPHEVSHQASLGRLNSMNEMTGWKKAVVNLVDCIMLIEQILATFQVFAWSPGEFIIDSNLQL